MKYVIENVLINPNINEVVSGEKVIRLEPKTMTVLILLAENAGRTISKEEIFDKIWPGMIVSEDSISRCISQLRKIFNDDTQHPRIIETIPKKGYRIKAPVKLIANEVIQEVATATTVTNSKKGISPWTGGILAFIVVIMMLYGAGFTITPLQGLGMALTAFAVVYTVLYYLKK